MRICILLNVISCNKRKGKQHTSYNKIEGSIISVLLWSSGSVVPDGFKLRPRHTKDVMKKVPDASLLIAQQRFIIIVLAFLSSKILFK